MEPGSDDLVGALGRLAAQAAATARSAAETASRELSGALGRDAPLRWPASLSVSGPVVPQPYFVEGHKLSWQDGYMASCAVSVARAVQLHGPLPCTAALVGVQAAAHARPGGYRLLQVGLNAHRVLDRGEWRRCASSLLVHRDLPHLVSNATSLVLEGLPLEARLGSARLAGLALSCAALAQGLYLGAAWLAARHLPRSALADEYYTGYSVGASGLAMALKVVAGYMREADLARARVHVTEDFMLTAGRLGAWPSVLMAQLLVPSANLAGHVAGILSGLLHVYGARAAAWLWRALHGGRPRLQGGRLGRAQRPPALLDLGCADHPGLGWTDLGAHALLGGGTLLAAYLAARSRKQG